MRATGLRLAIRLSRREVRRRPWRTLLVALLVAGPVAGMTVAVVLVRTDQLTPLEEWRLSYGGADAVVGRGSDEGATLAGRDLPPGSRVVRYQSDYRLIRTAEGRRASGEVTNLPVADPLVAETTRITGRAPAGPSEVLLSAKTAGKLRVAVGSTLDLDRPVDATLTVVGTANAVSETTWSSSIPTSPSRSGPAGTPAGTSSSTFPTMSRRSRPRPGPARPPPPWLPVWSGRSGRSRRSGRGPIPSGGAGSPGRWC